MRTSTRPSSSSMPPGSWKLARTIRLPQDPVTPLVDLPSAFGAASSTSPPDSHGTGLPEVPLPTEEVLRNFVRAMPTLERRPSKTSASAIWPPASGPKLPGASGFSTSCRCWTRSGLVASIAPCRRSAKQLSQAASALRPFCDSTRKRSSVRTSRPSRSQILKGLQQDPGGDSRSHVLVETGQP